MKWQEGLCLVSLFYVFFKFSSCSLVRWKLSQDKACIMCVGVNLGLCFSACIPLLAFALMSNLAGLVVFCVTAERKESCYNYMYYMNETHVQPGLDKGRVYCPPTT